MDDLVVEALRAETDIQWWLLSEGPPLDSSVVADTSGGRAGHMPFVSGPAGAGQRMADSLRVEDVSVIARRA